MINPFPLINVVSCQRASEGQDVINVQRIVMEYSEFPVTKLNIVDRYAVESGASRPLIPL